MLQLVAFLGNPGAQYERNRHNAGWMLAEAMPFFPVLDWHNKYKSLYACISGTRISAFGEKAADQPVTLPERLHFIKPQTYMNLSGESVHAAASFYKIMLNEIIVIHDDIELPFGTLSLKFSGGLGGHNGLRSMKDCFGSADFWRLRIGIGRPDNRPPGKGGSVGDKNASGGVGGIAGWVLTDFTAAEIDALIQVLNKGASLLLRALSVNPEHLLPQWAKKNCLEG
jgi:PTH1 family peptidyl-tRNA hydrolase